MTRINMYAYASSTSSFHLSLLVDILHFLFGAVFWAAAIAIRYA
jgi:hypothetical protein